MNSEKIKNQFDKKKHVYKLVQCVVHRKGGVMTDQVFTF